LSSKWNQNVKTPSLILVVTMVSDPRASIRSTNFWVLILGKETNK
jgi:hypothetical protein